MGRKKMLAAREGFEGAELHERRRPIPGTRIVQVTTIRSMPGSFTWRYGRAEPGTTLDMLFQAGTEFSRLVEAAGMDAPGTVDWSKAGSSQWNGLPPARLIALDQWKRMTQDLGKLVTRRLVQYVCEGKTSRQIARMYRRSEREMAAQLNSDLAMTAVYFGYAGRK